MVLIGCSPKKSSKEAAKAAESLTDVRKRSRGNLPALSSSTLKSEIVTYIGESLTQSELDQLRNTMEFVPELQDPKSKEEQMLFVRGEKDSGVISITARLKDDRVVAIDYTLISSNTRSSDLKKNLLLNYMLSGHRAISQLAPNLDTLNVPVTDYRNKLKGNLCASAFETGGVIRVTLFDSALVDIEQLIPTVEQLPPNLLEDARRILKQQREMNERKK